MQFSYHKNASSLTLNIKGDLYKYLIKARRHKIGDEIAFRNFLDNTLYIYKIVSINRQEAIFTLISSKKNIVENPRKLHIAWCLIEPKIIEKIIPSLNEIGVDKITFIYCKYSQNNFKLSFEKMEKILINSSCQCGRSSVMGLNECESLDKFLKKNPNTYALDFSQNLIDDKKNEIKTLVLGCEGGFSPLEKEYFKKDKIVGFDSNLILRSETAIISVASKILI